MFSGAIMLLVFIWNQVDGGEWVKFHSLFLWITVTN